MLRHHYHAALTIVACACSSDSGSAPGQGGTVRATIYGADSWGAVPGALAGVNVTIAGRSEITNELGVAYVTQLPPGSQEARIDRPGSELLETRVSVVVGDTVDMIEELTALRPAQGRIEVQVVTQQSSGSPVDILLQGAVVTLDQATVRITDENGAADFPFASSGGHWVRGEHTGTVPDSALVQLLGGDTARVRLRLDPVE